MIITITNEFLDTRIYRLELDYFGLQIANVGYEMWEGREHRAWGMETKAALNLLTSGSSDYFLFALFLQTTDHGLRTTGLLLYKSFCFVLQGIPTS